MFAIFSDLYYVLYVHVPNIIKDESASLFLRYRNYILKQDCDIKWRIHEAIAVFPDDHCNNSRD